MRPLVLLAVCCALHAPLSVRAEDPIQPPAYRLITLDPGHFHASLVQKFMVPDVDPLVHVYAPGGDDLAEHLKRIESFNARPAQPTHWREEIHTGPDYLERMLADRAGNLVVISGNNKRKTEYIARAIDAGFNVLGDKPMVIVPADFKALEAAFVAAEKKGVLLTDIMTERFEITAILQRELSQRPALFGTLVAGTAENPAISKISVHHFSKIVAGTPLRRPQWFFDVRQQGEGIVDVTTHLVDLVQWEAFPEQSLRPADAKVVSAKRWATPITLAQFRQVTGASEFPPFLRGDVRDGALQVYSNGEFTYRLRDRFARISVTWNFEAPNGGGDTHDSVMRGTLANLVIRQGALYVEKADGVDSRSFEAALDAAIASLQKSYPGVGWRHEENTSRVTIPEKYNVGHEAHFAQVLQNYLASLRAGRLPAWEVPNMLTKYSTIMQAYEMSRP